MFGVQPPGGIDDHVIGLAGGGGLQGIEEHGRRISSRFRLDHFGAGALAPNFQLLDGGGAEGVGRAHQHGLALRAKHLRQLSDGGGFAGTIYAHDHDDLGRAAYLGYRLGTGRG